MARMVERWLMASLAAAASASQAAVEMAAAGSGRSRFPLSGSRRTRCHLGYGRPSVEAVSREGGP